MTVKATYPHIQKRSGRPARLLRLPRIRVAQIVMDYLAYGWSADEMIRQHPALRPAEVHAAMTYYFDHREEVETEIRAEVEICDTARTKHPPSALVVRLLAKQRK